MLGLIERFATRGPWFIEADGIYNDSRTYMVAPIGDSEQDKSDARFIITARNVWPALLNVVECAEAGFAHSECGNCDAGLPMRCTCNEMDSALQGLRRAIGEMP